jgi:hypothetical protein
VTSAATFHRWRGCLAWIWQWKVLQHSFWFVPNSINQAADKREAKPNDGIVLGQETADGSKRARNTATTGHEKAGQAIPSGPRPSTSDSKTSCAFGEDVMETIDHAVDTRLEELDNLAHPLDASIEAIHRVSNLTVREHNA